MQLIVTTLIKISLLNLLNLERLKAHGKRINSAILLRKFYLFCSQLSTPVFGEHQKVSVTVTKIERFPVVKKKEKEKKTGDTQNTSGTTSRNGESFALYCSCLFTSQRKLNPRKHKIKKNAH